jgi:hypothetical protein
MEDGDGSSGEKCSPMSWSNSYYSYILIREIQGSDLGPQTGYPE